MLGIVFSPENILSCQNVAQSAQLSHCFFNESPVPTNIVPKSTWTRFEISLSSNTTNNNLFCFGSRTSSSASDKFYLQSSYQYTRFFWQFNGNSGQNIDVQDLGARTDLVIDGETVQVTNSGMSSSIPISPSQGFFNGSYGIVFGGVQNGASIPNARMIGYFYGCKIYDVGALAHHIVPAKDGDNVVYLWDKTTGDTYYPLSGTTILEEDPHA